ncbi:MAG TPA: fasciclin domain-containing protein [Chitinophagales bacterium]|nr:fasciclin domain-containing protein [Chitinophagales bacterium]
MKTFLRLSLVTVVALTLASCQSNTDSIDATSTDDVATAEIGAGQSAVVDNDSQKDVVKVAAASPDHTTLVAAVKAADLVNALSNAGPFTVFAPTNAAFDALPKGTVDNLLKPENQEQLADILQYHVTLSALEPESLTDGRVLGEVNGGSVKITRNGDKIKVNDANVLGNVRASNGMVYVIDKVLLPK